MTKTFKQPFESVCLSDLNRGPCQPCKREFFAFVRTVTRLSGFNRSNVNSEVPRRMCDRQSELSNSRTQNSSIVSKRSERTIVTERGIAVIGAEAYSDMDSMRSPASRVLLCSKSSMLSSTNVLLRQRRAVGDPPRPDLHACANPIRKGKRRRLCEIPCPSRSADAVRTDSERAQ